MGLDMYLYAKLSMSDYFSADHPIRAHVDAIDWPGRRNSYRDCEVKAGVAYWRKANQIHKWFVDNVQDGRDECQYSYVDLDQLKELRDLCRDLVLRKNSAEAAQKLPPERGFFFGGEEIDQWYWEQLVDTAAMLTAIVDHPNASGYEYEYHASW